MSDAPPPRIDLGKITALLVQASQLDMSIMSQMLRGFGMQNVAKCQTIEQAQIAIQENTFDLIILDGDIAGDRAFEFVQRLRRNGQSGNRFVSILLTRGHTATGNVMRARDSGVNFVVARPVTPKIMFDRLVWLARERRKFVDCEQYCGPDRRHKNLGPPGSKRGRRADDLSGKVGAAKAPNMSQDDIDAIFKPQKAAP